MTAIDERAALFGRSRNLVGILSRPGAETPVRRPAVLILNTGIVHRIGHHRMYVTMARQLAAAGHQVLRFDFSGIGDSSWRAGGALPLDACLTDVGEAVDWLTSTGGASEVVILGLCSGADVALRYGHADKRVVGLVLLDPTIPPTLRFYAHYIGHRLTRLRSWLTFARGRGRIWQDLASGLQLVLGAAPDGRPRSLIDPATRDELEHLYGRTIASGVRLLVVMTGGALQGRQTYREQLIDAFPDVPFAGHATIEHFESSDHIFTAPEERARLNELVLSWVDRAPSCRSLPSSKDAPNESLGGCAGQMP